MKKRVSETSIPDLRSETSTLSVTQRDFSPRRLVPSMTRRAPFPRIGLGEDFGEFKLLAFERSIAFQNLVLTGSVHGTGATFFAS
jgi:hypothetical protein